MSSKRIVAWALGVALVAGVLIALALVDSNLDAEDALPLGAILVVALAAKAARGGFRSEAARPRRRPDTLT